MEINGNYWVQMYHNGPAPEFFTIILLHVPNPFTTAINILAASFNHPNWAFSTIKTKHFPFFPVPSTCFPLDSKELK